MDKEEAIAWAYLFLAYAQGKKILVSDFDDEGNKIFRESEEEDEWILKAFEQIDGSENFKIAE